MPGPALPTVGDAKAFQHRDVSLQVALAWERLEAGGSVTAEPRGERKARDTGQLCASREGIVPSVGLELSGEKREHGWRPDWESRKGTSCTRPREARAGHPTKPGC